MLGEQLDERTDQGFPKDAGRNEGTGSGVAYRQGLGRHFQFDSCIRINGRRTT